MTNMRIRFCTNLLMRMLKWSPDTADLRNLLIMNDNAYITFNSFGYLQYKWDSRGNIFYPLAAEKVKHCFLVNEQNASFLVLPK